ncbi:zinc finger protein 81-like [Onthophagus taurus]|uniref:zinc finger protein 81-like n=1 Tax=Onthophagus taurus TaxID=166361 RepID=UPI0039BE5E13
MDLLTCRCCNIQLHPETISFPLNMRESLNELTLQEKLQKCVPELGVDNDPKVVMCVSCYSQLRTAYDFILMCLKTENDLSQNKKEELENPTTTLNDINKVPNKEMEQIVDCKISINRLPRDIKANETVYVCENCKSLFLSKWHYTEHLSRTKKCFLTCFLCNINFSSNVIFEMHMKFMHSQHYSCYKVITPELSMIIHKNQEDECTQPVENIEEDENLEVNVDQNKISKNKNGSVKRFRSNQDLKCVFCRSEFLNIVLLQQHYNSHQLYCYKCLKCNKIDVDKDRHNNECNSKDFIEPDLPDKRCPFCFKYYSNLQDLRNHLNTHNKFKLYCYKCSHHFNSIWEFALHVIINKCRCTQFVQNSENSVCCPICEKILSTKKILQVHFYAHSFNTTVCANCNKPFYDNLVFEEHLKQCQPLIEVEANTENSKMDVCLKQEDVENIESDALEENNFTADIDGKDMDAFRDLYMKFHSNPLLEKAEASLIQKRLNNLSGNDDVRGASDYVNVVTSKV